MSEYASAPSNLNVRRGTFGPMPCFDQAHPKPDDWLKANAKRFHFTDAQIISAAKPQAEHGLNYPQIWGIYFLVADGQIVYVGMSNHITRRVTQHAERGLQFDAVAWFEAPAEYLQDIEAYYIGRIRPGLNFDLPNYPAFAELVKALDEPPRPRLFIV